MKLIPIIRVTEMLSQVYGIFAVAVERQTMRDDASDHLFVIKDVRSQHWLMTARRIVSSAHAAGEHGAIQAHRWGWQWTLSTQAAPSSTGDDIPSVACGGPAGGAADVSQAVDTGDSRALERVGSWLAQPAGLPLATDIPGHRFIELWSANLEQMRTLHARAEQLHDDPRCASGDDHGHLARAWAQHHRVLQEVVELQRILLAAEGRNEPLHLRRRALRRVGELFAADNLLGAVAGSFARVG